jgi:hypothetical protein
MKNLDDNGTGEVINFEDIPKGATIYPSKLILKKKRDAENSFTKAKARLVVCSNLTKSIFATLFAPTANDKSIKLLFAMAMIFSMNIIGIDIKGAFLYPELKEPVFISLPRNLGGQGIVYWKLHKTLYGLSQSPKAFYEDVSHILLSHGYHRTNADPCFFYKFDDDGKIYMVVHVDDFAVAFSSSKMIDQLLETLKKRYELVVETNLESYLGIHIQYNKDGSCIFTQPGRIEELYNLHKDVIDKLPSPSVPMPSNFNDNDRTCHLKQITNLSCHSWER